MADRLAITVAASGNYRIEHLNEGIDATQFPLPCHFALVDTYNASDTFDGGTYLMVSTQGAAVTRSYSVSTTSSSHGIPGASGSATSSSPSTASPTASPTVTGPGSNQDKDNEGHWKGLSGGLIAAVVACSLIGSGGLVALIWWILRRRKSRPGNVETEKTVSEQTNIHEADSRSCGPELGGSGASSLRQLASRELPASTWASTELHSHPPVVHEMAARTPGVAPRR